MAEINSYNYDVVIIGTGGAGLALALFLTESRPNARIGMLCKSYSMGSHTTSAKGGINAALGNVKNDEIAWHTYDTINSGKGLCDTAPTRNMCENAPFIIEYLSKIGVNFDKTPNNKIDQRIYGGQTLNFGKGGLANRACFVGDFTGHAIMNALFQEAIKQNNIKIHNYRQVVDFNFNSNTTIAYNK
jgi:succinate dehydrogenase (ubiquinone) flavoprotein subunit